MTTWNELRLIISLIAASPLTACGPGNANPPEVCKVCVEAPPKDQEPPVTLLVGKEVTISLQSNEGTGYEWSAAKITPHNAMVEVRRFERLERDEIKRASHDPQFVGAQTGLRVTTDVTFRAVRTGAVTIRIDAQRGERDPHPIPEMRRFSVVRANTPSAENSGKE